MLTDVKHQIKNLLIMSLADERFLSRLFVTDSVIEVSSKARKQ